MAQLNLSEQTVDALQNIASDNRTLEETIAYLIEFYRDYTDIQRLLQRVTLD
jgi:hypothetical protein